MRGKGAGNSNRPEGREGKGREREGRGEERETEYDDGRKGKRGNKE